MRQRGHHVDQRAGEEIDVWFDPRRPTRVVAVLAENASDSSSWPIYLFSLVFIVVGGWLLIGRLR